MSTNQTKKCSKCGEIKSVDEFHKSTRDGYRSKCKKCRIYDTRQYYLLNKVDILEKSKTPENRKRKNILRNKRRKRYIPNWEKTEQYKLRKRLQRRILHALNKTVKKSAKTEELIGCSFKELKEHIESQFTDGMSWERISEIHVDHIRPCASFDLSDPKQQKNCFHYTNLQPLWAIDNLSKGDKWYNSEEKSK